MQQTLSVGVLIDGHWGPDSGGQIKSWEHFCVAAARLPNELDLTLHFLGERDRFRRQADNVSFVFHRPRIGTDRLRFLDEIPHHTDLAPTNPRLLPFLRSYDVIHTTHPLFTFGRTALRFASRAGTPLTNSVHTDVPRYARIYTERVIERRLGSGRLGRLLVERYRLGARREAAMQRRLRRYWRLCNHVLVSRPDDYEQVANVLPASRISYLRRGISPEAFHPSLRSRERLRREYEIGPDEPTLLYAGRLDDSKSCMTLVRAARLLLDRGHRLRVLCLGDGHRAADIANMLGPAVTLPGFLPQSELAWHYASADLFVFPSQTETFGNVVLEAKASGLPVLVSARGGSGQRIQRSGVDGVRIDSNEPEDWAREIAALVSQPQCLRALGAEARRHVERLPTWDEVFAEDLLAVWRAVANAVMPAA